MIKSTIFNTVILFSVLILLPAGMLVGCGNDTEEKAAVDSRQDQDRQMAAVEPRRDEAGDQAHIQPAPENQPVPGQAADNLVGKKVVGSDGRMLGTVAELYGANEASGYAIIKDDGDRLHPVPVDLINEDPEGEGLRAEFDSDTFQRAPAFSQAARQQFSDTRLNEVRGYYENHTGINRQMPSDQPEENNYQRKPGTGNTENQK